jgi:hypothetical protein
MHGRDHSNKVHERRTGHNQRVGRGHSKGSEGINRGTGRRCEDGDEGHGGMAEETIRQCQ